jgi:hypothetical protein
MNKSLKPMVCLALLVIIGQLNTLLAGGSQADEKEETRPVQSFHISGMPVAVDEASLINHHWSAELKYRITNLTDENIKEIYLLAFIFDKDGKFNCSQSNHQSNGNMGG